LHTGSLFACNSQLSIIVICANLRIFHSGRRKKIYYLQSCLTGEAKHVIEALSISSDNYQVAWELLKERYENKRLIGQTHIQAIFNLPAITKASATSLRLFSDSIGVHLKALKALERATDQWDDLLIYTGYQPPNLAIGTLHILIIYELL
jgi:hypothetical protein